MNKQMLLEWEAGHHAMKHTIDGFWRCYGKWSKEEREDYLKTFHGKLYPEFISVGERAIYLKYTFDCAEAVVFCSVNISYLETRIGTYDVEFNLEGEVNDEYLDFDKDLFQHKLLEIKHFLRIARKAIKEGLETTTISNINGIDAKYLDVLREKYV